MDVTWLGHSTVVLDLDDTRVLVDPLLSRHNGPLRRRFVTPEQQRWQHPDVVLISHLHHDHAELRSLRLLGDVPVLTAPLNAAWLRRKGISGATGLGDDWYDVADSPVRVRLVKAVHHARPMPHRPNQANGHIVKGSSMTVWVVGDTSLYDEMTDLPQVAGAPFDLAIVPVGGWGARLSPGHMGPAEAAVACARVRARAALAVHWGTLHVPFLRELPRGWMDRPGDEFAKALAKAAPDCEPISLMPGQSSSVPAAAS
jgi:L-ascorbate metabolism protein UlaG (beta-lactamase superfamily)